MKTIHDATKGTSDEDIVNSSATGISNAHNPENKTIVLKYKKASISEVDGTSWAWDDSTTYAKGDTMGLRTEYETTKGDSSVFKKY